MSRWQEAFNDPVVIWTAVAGIVVILAGIGVFVYVFFALNTASCIHGTGPC